MLSDVLIGIDMGTGSSKGVATTITGEILATSTRPRPNSMSMPRPGWAEVDADAIWWADVVSLSRELTARVADHQLAGVCVSGVGPCLVLATRTTAQFARPSCTASTCVRLPRSRS